MSDPATDPATDPTVLLEAELAADIATAVSPDLVTTPDPDQRALVYVHPNSWTLGRVDLDQYRPRPSRSEGIATLSDPDSFVAYVNRQSLAAGHTLALYGDRKANTVLALFDDHDQGGPGWRQHGAVLQLEPTEEWTAIQAVTGQFLDPTDMADWLDEWDHLVVDPPTLDIRELVTNFRVMRTVTFDRAENNASGDVSIRYAEETNGYGAVVVPTRIILAAAPFHGANVESIEAAFRYRAARDSLKFGVKALQTDKLFREAFQMAVDAIATRLETPPMFGRPMDNDPRRRF